MLRTELRHGIFVLMVLQLTSTERRIKNGRQVESDKNYAVYLVKAPPSPRLYTGWLCGGALVTPLFIVTSAACVEDVQHLYAIAGYKKYVQSSMLDTDPCTKAKKKKIVFICVPKSYELDYTRIEKWSWIDIAVVKVESPYDFNDVTYKLLCSYIPNQIEINFEPKYQEPGTDAMALGWGHKDKWRNVSDLTNYNQEILNYAPTLIQNKRQCKKLFEGYEKLNLVIDKYMICTWDAGNINDRGEQIFKSKPVADGCRTQQQKLTGTPSELCDEALDEAVLVDDTRKSADTTFINGRKNGICQNDHGGPLVTWVGMHEVLIGVASVFRLTNESVCTGPYLFTSTQCNGAFLDCILNSNISGRRQALCDKPPTERGFDMVKREISWIGHPDGPAENEMIHSRPQVSIYRYGKD